jgi:hypothetical protein
MAKTVQQELLALRRRVRQFEGGKSAEDVLPFLRTPSSGGESFDDQVEKQRREVAVEICNIPIFRAGTAWTLISASEV